MNSAVISLVSPVRKGQVVKLMDKAGGSQVYKIGQIKHIKWDSENNRWIVWILNFGGWHNADRCVPMGRSN